MNTIPVDIITVLYENLDDGDLYCFLTTCKSFLSYLYIKEFSSYLFKMDTSDIPEDIILELFCRFCRFDKMNYMNYIVKDPYLITVVNINFFDYFINQRRQAIDLYDDKYENLCDIISHHVGEDIWKYKMEIKTNDYKFLEENIRFNKGDYYKQARTFGKNFTLNILSCHPYSIKYLEKINDYLEKINNYLYLGAIPTSSDLRNFLVNGMDKDRLLSLAKKFQLSISSFIHLFGYNFLVENICKYGISIETLKYIIKHELFYLLEFDTYLNQHPTLYIRILLDNKPVNIYAIKRFIDLLDSDHTSIFMKLYSCSQFELSSYMSIEDMKLDDVAVRYQSVPFPAPKVVIS